MNVFTLSKTIDAPIEYVYSWCTDFTPEHLGLSKESRKMLQTSNKRAIYIEIYSGPDGGNRMGVDIITMTPRTSWHMEYFGEDNDEIGDYSLQALGTNKTRLEMSFRNRWKGKMSLSTEEKSKIESDAWDGYIESLERDFQESVVSHRMESTGPTE